MKHYDLNNYNCAHFVADWYRDNLGIEIPVVNEFGLSFVMWLKRHFEIIKRPEQNCLVVMTNRDNSLHIGVFHDHMVHHNFKPATGKGSTCAWPLTSVKNEYVKVVYARWLQ